MANQIEKCGIRFCNNNYLLDDEVFFTSETDYNGNTFDDVFDTRNFGVYRLTKDPVDDAFIFDITLPGSIEPASFALLPADYNNFYLTAETEITIEASNFGFDTIEKTFTGKHSRFGVFCNFTELKEQNSYRYWRIRITTGNRTEFDDSLDIKYAYFGDHVGLATRNIATGFGVGLKDLSQVFMAESGREYFNKKDKQMNLTGLRFQYMNDQDRVNFQQFYYCVGKTENFLTILDPDGVTEAEIGELNRIYSFNAIPGQTHQIRDLFENTFALKEAL